DGCRSSGQPRPGDSPRLGEDHGKRGAILDVRTCGPTLVTEDAGPGMALRQDRGIGPEARDADVGRRLQAVRGYGRDVGAIEQSNPRLRGLVVLGTVPGLARVD